MIRSYCGVMKTNDEVQISDENVEQPIPNQEKKLNVLDEIILGRATDESAFNTYKKKSEIGGYILEQLMKRERNNVFLPTEVSREKGGVLTQCRGLQTMGILSKFGVDLTPYEGLISGVLGNLFWQIDDETGGYIFDATPYLNTPFKKEEYKSDPKFVKDYVDTISSVLMAMVAVRSIIAEYRDGENKKPLKIVTEDSERSRKKTDVLKATEDTIHECIRRLNKFAIRCDPEPFVIEGETMGDIYGRKSYEFKGWNFTGCADEEQGSLEPSLYFTYVVSLAYMTLFEELVDPIEVSRDKYRSEDSRKISEKRLKNLQKSAKYKRDSAFFENIRSDFEEFNKRCMDAGRWIDTAIRKKEVDISERFLSPALGPVTMQEIMNSTTNDAPFNTLMVIGILINSGVDIDYKIRSEMGIGNESLFDDYYESLQYALQNVEKCYKNLQKVNRESAIDQYMLNFSERMPRSLQDQAKLLRSQKISMLSLMPLIIKTYNVISDYLIRYPQKQAITYLRYIMENRYVAANGQKRWIWDKDGYNINVNHMYVEALNSFYDYYQTYEEKYSNNAKEAFDRIENDYNTRLKEESEAYEAKRKDLEAANAELQKELDEHKKAPLVDEVEKIVTAKMTESFETMFAKILSDIYYENLGEDPESEKISDLFINALLSYLGEGMKDHKKKVREQYAKGRNEYTWIMNKLRQAFDNQYLEIMDKHFKKMGDSTSEMKDEVSRQ